jgi:hypothetical protein
MNKELIKKIKAFAQGNEELAMQTDSSFEFGIVAAYEYLQRQPISDKQILKVLLINNDRLLKDIHCNFDFTKITEYIKRHWNDRN